MSSSTSAKESTARIAVFPEAVGKVSVAIIGVQHRDRDAMHSTTDALRDLLNGRNKPGSLERFSYTDDEGFFNDVFMGYWLHDSDYSAWRNSTEVTQWLAQLSMSDNAAGVWLEAMSAPVERYQYGAPVVQKDGLARLGELAKSDKFGYWGGYRDRVPASVYDKFESPLAYFPTAVSNKTVGRRVTLDLPDNVVFIREGQDWSKAGQEERDVWKNTMDSVVTSWTGILVNRATESGTLSLRSMKDSDTQTGQSIEKQTQIAFLLSLDGIERAARTWKEHLDVHASLIRMFREATFKPTMNIWAEMFVLKAGEMKPVYINCHPKTGLLPYFPAMTESL